MSWEDILKNIREEAREYLLGWIAECMVAVERVNRDGRKELTDSIERIENEIANTIENVKNTLPNMPEEAIASLVRGLTTPYRNMIKETKEWMEKIDTINKNALDKLDEIKDLVKENDIGIAISSAINTEWSKLPGLPELDKRKLEGYLQRLSFEGME